MMVGFSNGFITLDEHRSIYYSGQELSGSVNLQLEQAINFSVLTITYLGQASVLWTEEQREEYNGVVRHSLVKYLGQEEYFNYTEYLAGGRGISQLPAGQQKFNFKFQIPPSAPSTFKGEKGGVSYSITVCLVNPEPLSQNETITKEFEVVAPLNLNIEDPVLKQPIQLEFEEVYACNCLCNSDPMTVRVKLPVSGYCPGQVMPISVEADNESNIEIHKIIFQLVSRECYKSKQPIAEYIPPENILVTIKKGPIMGKCRRNFTADLVVPDMLAPNLGHCSIIDVQYFVKITLKLSGCNDDLTDESEIFIGLVPLSEVTKGEYTHPMAHSLPTGPIPDPNTLYIPVQNPRNSLIESNNHPQSYPQSNYPPPPYPGQNVPYPVQNAPYPGQNVPYPGQNAPYPGHNTPYPAQAVLYPGQNIPYPYPPEKVIAVANPTNAIGFKQPEMLNNAPFSQINPLYPLSDSMPRAACPYPVESDMCHPGKDLRINLPPINNPVQPSAPPASS